MICPHCQHQNRPTANFCMNCGERIGMDCLVCGTKLPIGANYCDSCGAPLKNNEALSPVGRPPAGSEVIAPQDGSSTAGRADSVLSRYIPKELASKLKASQTEGRMAGERRVVTMLFCDVIGSTTAAEQLDPEDWSAVINMAFEHMIKPVYRYEGTVARLMGDAILAFFGAPIAHEDDPNRAVLAGLDILSGIQTMRSGVHDRYGIDINVRVGINTGLVVVGAVGSDLRMEYTALGDAINVAARMEETAQPGTVLVSHNTYRLVRDDFTFEEAGKQQVKGRQEPVVAYQVLGRSKTSQPDSRLSGMHASLVGRQLELASFNKVLEGVAQGIGHIICLISEAGLGKSRLIAEVFSDWQAQNSAAVFHQISCRSYESGQPYRLIRLLFQRLMEIEPDDPEESKTRKIQACLEKYGSEKSPGAFSAFSTLLGLETVEGGTLLTGEAFKRELYAAVEGMILDMFKNQPGALAFEDIHWSDQPSVELLEHILPLADRIPLVLVFSFRPDQKAASWSLRKVADDLHRRRYTEIYLQPFSPKESGLLIDSLLDNPDMPESMCDLIIERAGGNPFFIEEILRTFMDNGTLVQEISSNGSGRTVWRSTGSAEEMAVPENLLSLFNARVDRLEEGLRQTFQLASVIGRTFPEPLLAGLVDDRLVETGELQRQLEALIRLDLINETASQPDLEYAFRNPMIQEATYKSILKTRRREIHLRIAETLESLYPERKVELASQLGFHFSRAGEQKRACEYYSLAGDNAFRLFANSLALNFYREALAAARLIPDFQLEDLKHLYSRLGRTLELESRFQEAAGVYQEQLKLAREMDEASLELAALIALGTVYSRPSEIVDPVKAEGLSKEALKLAEKLGDKSAQAHILWNLMNIYRIDMRNQEAVELAERGLELARESGDREIEAYIYNDLPYAYAGTYEIEKANNAANQAVKIWRELNNQPMLVDSLSALSFAHLYFGRYDQAIAAADEAQHISREIENPWGIGYSRFYVGYVYQDRGLIDQALRDYEITSTMGEKADFTVGQYWGKALLANLYVELNALDRARSIIENCERGSHEFSGMLALFASMVKLSRVSLLLASSQPDQARRLFTESGIDQVNQNFITWDWIQESHIRIALGCGDLAEAVKMCDREIKKLRSLSNRSRLHHIYLMKGTAHLGLGEFKLASAALDEAQTVAGELEARWILWQIYASRSQLAAALGDSTSSARFRDEASQLVRDIGALISQPELKESFLKRPDVALLLDG
ncbi:MAG: adenylate/guanylate cyclase domain-containing protein [Anaerolineales bacterium]